MGKSKQLKMIRKAAKDLPVIMRPTVEKHYVTGAEMRLLDEMDDQAKKGRIEDIKDDQIYIQKFPVYIAINHGRNLKKLVKKFGTSIIEPYREEAIKASVTN